MSDDGDRKPRWGTLVPVVVAVIGLIASPVWGPPICQAIGLCKASPTTAPTTAPTQRPGDGFSIPLPGSASIFLSSTGGPTGSQVRVSGQGFAAGETVVIRFHTTEVARTTANAAGSFSGVEITIPEGYAAFAPSQFFVVATGSSSVRSARAPYTLSG